MKRVFIGGSRRGARINPVIRERLDAIIENGLCVLIGDANGADKAVQKHLADRGYPNVTVFHSGSACRNNLGNWHTRAIVAESQKRDFAYYAAKDAAMANEADYGFMLWDGESSGTLNNILNLLRLDRQVVVFFSPQTRCVTIRDQGELKALMGDRFESVSLGLEAKKVSAATRAHKQFEFH